MSHSSGIIRFFRAEVRLENVANDENDMLRLSGISKFCILDFSRLTFSVNCEHFSCVSENTAFSMTSHEVFEPEIETEFSETDQKIALQKK